MGQNQDNQQRLETARALVASLESGDQEESERLIASLTTPASNDQLFLEVGRLTRELHEAINGFLLDAKISDMTTVEIPDAKERLTYVITMTEQSADRTLTAVEKSMPLIESIEKQSTELSEQWERLRSRMLDKDEFADLSRDLSQYLIKSKEDAAALHNNLSDVLMAQDFQDLTGQIIRKVITLVHDVEEKLVMLVRITGNKLEDDSGKKEKEELAGPAIPGLDQGDQVTSQDDVDDLLSSLGF
ncbi:MAG: protein phosphatase CheZ [Candidatus Thiodiazotropha taylori]|uniref:Protein phosphatase CheZ n=1 Tax=Candidatus Thiodiazotropha taylori TaxID=2792791 RepID=A0A9E4KGE7_9GAMM|nr:protein phosphatase CheZ [Candidatus Thiodiazotropha taylori]RLW66978.1 MAG: chemotaxis protein CheZ [gamma proteobacterium symbiont of Stewartia floridana]MCG7924034.1 protein phosphatase CheZ [Candidatus Thiodiazotropha taylori]MCG7934240.1 protein phosphatase CheZ [Candidatus Thiodiazotropha taylori]MCG7947644.1 protein phosphatase CheZ [Candidatus Thiodiazotropha taylori]